MEVGVGELAARGVRTRGATEGVINIDFVPSVKRPPRGGSWSGDLGIDDPAVSGCAGGAGD